LKANSESNQLGQSERKREVASLHTHTHTRRHSATSYISSEIAKSAVLLLASTVMGEGVIISSIGCSLFVANKKKRKLHNTTQCTTHKKKKADRKQKNCAPQSIYGERKGEREETTAISSSVLSSLLSFQTHRQHVDFVKQSQMSRNVTQQPTFKGESKTEPKREKKRS
jgi:hypothetical protein